LDEVIVDIDRIETMKKQYTRKYTLLVLGLIGLGLSTIILSEDEMGLDSVFDYVGVVIFSLGLILSMIGLFKPSLLKIADFDYHKTVLTNKWEYDDFKKSDSKKEDWKR